MEEITSEQSQVMPEAASDTSVTDTSSEESSSTVQDETVQVGVYQLFSNSEHYDRKSIFRMVIDILKKEPTLISGYLLYDTVVLVANNKFSNRWESIRPYMLESVGGTYWIKISETNESLPKQQFNRFIKRVDSHVYNKMLARLCAYHYSPVDIRSVNQSERRKMLLDCGYKHTELAPVIIKSLEGIYVMNREIQMLIDPSHIMCSNSLRTPLKYNDLKESNDMTDRLLITSAIVLAAYLAGLFYAANML